MTPKVQLHIFDTTEKLALALTPSIRAFKLGHTEPGLSLPHPPDILHRPEPLHKSVLHDLQFPITSDQLLSLFDPK